MYTINSISKSYGKQNILNNISFSFVKGDCVGLLGVNGSGKTTLLNILANTSKCDSGSFSFGANETISYLPQENPLLEDLSALDNLKLWYKGPSRDILSGNNLIILQKLGVTEFLKKKVKSLSGGMKKRLSLAIAMLSYPSLLILDEPLAALDILCKQDLIRFLQEYLRSGGTILMATHDYSALSICNKVFTITKGTLDLRYDRNINNTTITEEQFAYLLRK